MSDFYFHRALHHRWHPSGTMDPLLALGTLPAWTITSPTVSRLKWSVYAPPAASSVRSPSISGVRSPPVGNVELQFTTIAFPICATIADYQSDLPSTSSSLDIDTHQNFIRRSYPPRIREDTMAGQGRFLGSQVHEDSTARRPETVYLRRRANIGSGRAHYHFRASSIRRKYSVRPQRSIPIRIADDRPNRWWCLLLYAEIGSESQLLVR